MDHWPPSIPFATWLCCFSHNLIELLPYPLDLDWPCDLLWPTKCGEVTMPVLWSGYKGFGMLSLFLLKPCHHHMNKPRPACWRMRHEEEMPDIPAENIWVQSIFSQSFKTWEGLEPQSYSAPTTDAWAQWRPDKENIHTTSRCMTEK